MMYRLCRGGLLKRFEEIRILHEESLQHTVQIGILNAADEFQKLLRHLRNPEFADGKIICWGILALSAFAHALYIDLQCALKAGHITIYFYVIHTVKVFDPRVVRIPDLGIYGASLIL